MNVPDDDVRDRSIAELIETSHSIAREKGWWDKHDGNDDHQIPTLLMLMVSELAEALEEHRNGRGVNEIWFGKNGKPEGIPVEIADVMIRVFDMAGGYRMDLLRAINLKEKYNRGRPRRHGGKVV